MFQTASARVIYIDNIIPAAIYVYNNELILSRVTMTTPVTVGNMLQMALGAAEAGTVNLNILHSFLYTVMKK